MLDFFEPTIDRNCVVRPTTGRTANSVASVGWVWQWPNGDRDVLAVWQTGMAIKLDRFATNDPI
jgi:hypothetical protein